jgi:threonine dehydrogenase-like Zn-dependent dehydrogenase
MNDFNQNVYTQHNATGLAERTSHSGIGVSSFVLASLGAVSMFAMVVVAGVLESQSPTGMDKESAAAIIIGLGMIGIAFIMLLSAGLGIASIVQSTKKRLFGILGLCMSVGVVGIFLLLLIVGLMMG